MPLSLLLLLSLSLQSTQLPVYLQMPGLSTGTLWNPPQTNCQSPVFRHPSNLTDSVKKSKPLKAEKSAWKIGWRVEQPYSKKEKKKKGKDMGEGEEEEKGSLLKMHCCCGNVALPWKQLIRYWAWNAGLSVIQVLILGENNSLGTVSGMFT